MLETVADKTNVSIMLIWSCKLASYLDFKANACDESLKLSRKCKTFTNLRQLVQKSYD